MLNKKEEEEFDLLVKKYGPPTLDGLEHLTNKELEDVRRLFSLRMKKFEGNTYVEVSDEDIYYDSVYDKCLTLLASRAVV